MTRRPRTCGFTLLELLIALSILAVVSTLLVNGLRTTTRAWDAVEQRTTASSEEHLSVAFLRRQLELAQPLRPSRKADRKEIGFLGEREAMQFIAPLPGHLGPGGMYWFMLELVDGQDGKRLVLTYELFQREDWERLARPELETVVLKDGLHDVEFAYFEPSGPERAGGWISTWVAQEQLPRLIRVRLFERPGAARPWQDLFVAPRLAVARKADA